MDTLTTRGFQAGDAAAMTALLNQLDEDAGGHPGWTVYDVGEMITALVRDTGSDTRLLFDPDGNLIAAGLTSTPPAGGHRIDALGGVLPGWRGRGIGRDLLSWQLERAGQIHAAVAPDAGWEVHTGALVGDAEAIKLFSRFAMTPVRYWFEMVAPTMRVPDLATPDGLRIATYTPEHETAVHSIHTEAFADHWGYQSRGLQEWTEMTVRSDTFLPKLSALAFDGDEMVGYLLSYEDAEPTRLYIGQVGVRRPWRRRGLAGALLARVLTDAGRVGMASAGLGVDADSPTGAVGVYERVGFAVESRSVSYARTLPPR